MCNLYSLNKKRDAVAVHPRLAQPRWRSSRQRRYSLSTWRRSCGVPLTVSARS